MTSAPLPQELIEDWMLFSFETMDQKIILFDLQNENNSFNFSLNDENEFEAILSLNIKNLTTNLIGEYATLRKYVVFSKLALNS